MKQKLSNFKIYNKAIVTSRARCQQTADTQTGEQHRVPHDFAALNSQQRNWKYALGERTASSSAVLR